MAQRACGYPNLLQPRETTQISSPIEIASPHEPTTKISKRTPAIQVASSSTKRRLAQGQLESTMWAASSSAPRASQLALCEDLCKVAGTPLFPITRHVLGVLYSSMAAAKYRSIPTYIGTLFGQSAFLGHDIPESVQSCNRLLSRAATRDLGPAQSVAPLAADILTTLLKATVDLESRVRAVGALLSFFFELRFAEAQHLLQGREREKGSGHSSCTHTI